MFSQKAFSVRCRKVDLMTIKVIDKDGSGEIDFQEFVLAVWNYCSFDKDALITFAFSLYDKDDSGDIDVDEATCMIREVWGSEWEQNATAKKILAKMIILAGESGEVLLDQFHHFAQRHTLLLFPAFQVCDFNVQFLTL